MSVRYRIRNLLSRWMPPAIFDAAVAAFSHLPVDRPYRFANYQGVTTRFDAKPLHIGRFADAYEKFRRLDPHLSADITRYRNYNVSTLASLCRNIPGNYVFAGISYGVAARVLYEFVDFEKLGKTLYLIDPFNALNPADPRGKSDFYNTSVEYVRAQYPPDAPVEVRCDVIPDALADIDQIAFAALNTNHVPAETASVPIIFDKLSPGGMMIIDTYGTADGRFADFDPVFENIGANPLWFPSGQCAIVKS
jgi:hypothetical protein